MAEVLDAGVYHIRWATILYSVRGDGGNVVCSGDDDSSWYRAALLITGVGSSTGRTKRQYSTCGPSEHKKSSGGGDRNQWMRSP